jgi:chromosome segregation ATPase
MSAPSMMKRAGDGEKEELVETIHEMANFINGLELKCEAQNTEITGLLNTIQDLRDELNQISLGASERNAPDHAALSERLMQLQRGLEEKDKERASLRRRVDDLERDNSLMKYELGKVDKDTVKELKAEKDRLALENQEYKKRLERDQEFLVKLKADAEERERVFNQMQDSLQRKVVENEQLNEKLIQTKDSYAADLKNVSSLKI